MTTEFPRAALSACFVSIVALTATSTAFAQQNDQSVAGKDQQPTTQSGRNASDQETRNKSRRDKGAERQEQRQSQDNAERAPQASEGTLRKANRRAPDGRATAAEKTDARQPRPEAERKRTKSDAINRVKSAPDNTREQPEPTKRTGHPEADNRRVKSEPAERQAKPEEGRLEAERNQGKPAEKQPGEPTKQPADTETYNDSRKADRNDKDHRDSRQGADQPRDGGKQAGTGDQKHRDAKDGEGRANGLFAKPRPQDEKDDLRNAHNRDQADQTRDLSGLKKRRETRKEDDGRLEVIVEPGQRRIIREGGRAFIRNDDGHRFRRFGNRRVETRGDRKVVIIERPNGVRIVSIYDGQDRLVERRRRWRGRDTVLIDNSRAVGVGVAIGIGIGALVVGLSEPQISIPRRRYIVEYDDASDDELYVALTAPPTERLERGYALDEIKYSPNLRARTRRIDLNAVNFESGSWELTSGQQAKFERLARAMRRAIEENPNEIFLVEGHTDAVGSDIDNLSLSDRRAETVAELLTVEYGIPPENLVTQGYGEQQLKVQTESAEAANRRVAVRRITPLLARGS